MFRFLIIFLIFYIVYKIAMKFFSKDNKNKYNNIKDKHVDGEKMVPCEHCKIYVPESKIFKMDGKFFCSKECIDKFLEK